MNKYNKEEQEFLNLFEMENATADSLFKSRLKTKMLKELEPRFSIFGFLNTSGFSFAAIVIFSAVSVISGSYILSQLSSNQQINSVTVASNQVKQEVVEKVAEKTSVTALKLLQVDEFLSNETLIEPTRPIDESYNFKTTEVTFIPKKQSLAFCSNLNLPTKLTVTQLYEYFDTTKTISKLTQNNQTIAFMEFESGVENLPASYPVSMPVSFATKPIVETLLLDFSENLELIENSNKDSRTFTLTDEIVFDCGNNPVSFPVSFTVSQDIIIREFVLTPDYSIKTVNLYLNQISNNSKLAEITISSSTKNLSKTDASELLEEDLL